MRDLKLEEGQDSLEEHANGIFFKGRIIENIIIRFVTKCCWQLSVVRGPAVILHP